MARKTKLTWQAGSGRRPGRWRKKYKGKVHYFAGGSGKSDRDAYDAALVEWEKLKRRIDDQAPKPHQADYDRAIAQWELVLTWCRKHREDEMADKALAKLELLRTQLTVPKPKPVAVEDTFEGHFDQSVRYPGLDEALAETAKAAERSPESESAFSNLPGYDEYIAASERFFEAVSAVRADTGIRTVIAASPIDSDRPDSLHTEREVWRDRIQVMQRSNEPEERSVKKQVEAFVKDKEADAAAGLLTPGRIEKLRGHLGHFRDWLGSDTAVTDVKGSALIEYRAELLKAVEAGTWSRTTANERMGTVKTFVRWLWHAEAIPLLPRVLDGRSNVLDIGKSQRKIVVFSKNEIKRLLKKASERTTLYILLMLNCGMTQKDISDLDFSEIDWKLGRITRKRSKTRRFANVPTVGYVLWPETLALLRTEQSPAGSGRILLNKSGNPLWHEELGKAGKYKKNDNVRNAFHRLQTKTDIGKPLLSLKKTSASLIAGKKEYSGLENLFLGHAPQKISERHYAKAPQELLDEAVGWLRGEYGIAKVITEKCAASDNSAPAKTPRKDRRSRRR